MSSSPKYVAKNNHSGIDEDTLLKTETVDDSTSQVRHQKEYTLYGWRWVIVTTFCASVTASGLGMMGFSPITTIIQELYGINDFEGQLLMLVFVILYIPLMFPANYLIENKGISIPIWIASVTMIAGAWIRMLVNVNFYFVLIGQILMAFGQPFMMTAPPKLAGLWFSDDEQALATTLGSLAQPIGCALGFVLPLIFISDDDKYSSDGQSKFAIYILVQSIIITVLGLPIIFCVKDKPKTPPSKSAEKSLYIQIESQFSSLWKLVKNKDFLTILFGFSFIFSIYITLGSTVSQISDSFGDSSSDNSIFGTVFIFSGLVGSFAHAIPLDIYQFYRYQYILIGVLCILSTIAFTAA